MSSEEPLNDCVERLNTHIQRRGPLTLPTLFKELTTALKLHWKLPLDSISSPSSSKTPEPFTSAFPFDPPVSPGTPPTQPLTTASLLFNGFRANSERLKSDESVLSPADPLDLPLSEKNSEAIEADIKEWIAGNPDSTLQLISILPHDNGSHRVINLTIREPPMPFEVVCDENWSLIAISSSNEVLEQLVEIVTDYLEKASPTLPTFFDHFTTLVESHGDSIASGSIDEIANALRELIIDEEGNNGTWQRVIPTVSDWENHIFPGIRRAMYNDGMERWQVEEWMGRIRLEFSRSSGEYNDVLQYIIHNIFNGNAPPRDIRKFFPPPLTQPFYRRVTLNEHWKYPAEATTSAKDALKAEAAALEQLGSKEHGLRAIPIRNNLFHWEVTLSNFPPESQLGQALVNYTFAIAGDDRSIFDANNRIIPVDIVIEVMFPPTYPSGKPLIRIIRPRLVNNSTSNLFPAAISPTSSLASSTSAMSPSSSPSIPSVSVTPSPAPFNDSDNLNFDLDEEDYSLSDPLDETVDEENEVSDIHDMLDADDIEDHSHQSLTVSMILEKHASTGSRSKILDFLLSLKRKLLSFKDISIDTSVHKNGFPTDGNFWKEFSCIDMATIAPGVRASDIGGKIYLPSNALQEIMGRSLYGSSGLVGSGMFSDSPMVFELSVEGGRRTFVGVMEFTAPDGFVGLPLWMMNSLGLTPGSTVQVRKVKLQKGLFFQLQPHSAEFHSVGNVKAMMEWVLRRFVALSEGDTVTVEHDGRPFVFNVLKCTPDRAIAITDADVSVEFVAPLEGDVAETKSALTRSQEIRNIEQATQAAENVVTAGAGDTQLQGEEGVDYKTCPNCRVRLPLSNSLHELTCIRRNSYEFMNVQKLISRYCELCNRAVLKTEFEQHMEDVHALVPCDWCEQKVEKRQVLLHKKSECSGRSVICQYCEMKMLHRQLFDHEQSCGAVTEICSTCNDRYPRRELAGHLERCTGERGQRRDYNRVREEHFMTCERCKAPFTAFDELQVHILTVHDDEIAMFGLFGGPGFKTDEVKSDEVKGDEVESNEMIGEELASAVPVLSNNSEAQKSDDESTAQEAIVSEVDSKSENGPFSLSNS